MARATLPLSTVPPALRLEVEVAGARAAGGATGAGEGAGEGERARRVAGGGELAGLLPRTLCTGCPVADWSAVNHSVVSDCSNTDDRSWDLSRAS